MKFVKLSFAAVLVSVVCLVAVPGGTSASGLSFTNKTTSNGLGSNSVNGVFVDGTTVYAATDGGLSISTNGGSSFTNKTTANGLGDNFVRGVFVDGTTVYAATNSGLSISTNGGSSFTNTLAGSQIYDVVASGANVYAANFGNGLAVSTNGGSSFSIKSQSGNGLASDLAQGVAMSGSKIYVGTRGGVSITTDGGGSFTNKTTANGLGNNYVNRLLVSGSTVYAGTMGGLSISIDSGGSFTNKTTSNGLGDNFVRSAFLSGSTLYAATNGGLSISTNGGSSFTNYTTSDGLGNNEVRDVFVSGSTVYAATSGGLSISVPPGLDPVLDTPVQTLDGFTVNVTNWDPAYTWTPTMDQGSATAGTPSGSTLPITVTGLSKGYVATLTVTTTRAGYGPGTATASAARLVKLVPVFDTPVATANGFTVNVTNWDTNWNWARSVSAGSVAAGTPSGGQLPLTVTGLSAGASATVTVNATRSQYDQGTGTVTGATIQPARAPVFDTPVATADGFTVNVTNWDTNWSWTPAVSSGSVAAGTVAGGKLPLTVSGLSAGGSATVTVTTARTGYSGGSGTVSGTASAATTTTAAPSSSSTSSTVATVSSSTTVAVSSPSTTLVASSSSTTVAPPVTTTVPSTTSTTSQRYSVTVAGKQVDSVIKSTSAGVNVSGAGTEVTVNGGGGFALPRSGQFDIRVRGFAVRSIVRISANNSELGRITTDGSGAGVYVADAAAVGAEADGSGAVKLSTRGLDGKGNVVVSTVRMTMGERTLPRTGGDGTGATSALWLLTLGVLILVSRRNVARR